MNGQPETILVSPMQWGLGHTVRLVPFIARAVEDGHQVILASDGASLDFLRFRFPDLRWVRLPFYPVRYASDGRFFRKLIAQAPGILKAIRNNRRQVDKLISTYGITRILCDHRYGLYHKQVHSIFITNQLWLKAPKGWSFGEGLVYWFHKRVLEKFSEVWIADYPGTPNISGLLTHPRRLPANARYIGPVSRFENVTPERPAFARSFDVLALVSGPEPQRTLFENLLRERFKKDGTSAVIFRGLPPASPEEIPAVAEEGTVMLVDHARDEHLAWYIVEAREIICRPGNSTLCDLNYFGKPALLVPTPGQTEQEYVAKHLEAQGKFRLCPQSDLIPVETGAY